MPRKPSESKIINFPALKPPRFTPQELGSFLREHRLAKKLTHAKLAELVGVTRQTVQNWENGKYKPDFDSIPKLCALLDFTLQDLFGSTYSADDYNPMERRIIRNLRELTPVSARMVERIVFDMLDEEQQSKNRAFKDTFRIFAQEPGSAAAGNGIEFVEEKPVPVFLRKTRANLGADAVIRVSGPSMEPDYHDGDYVYFTYTNQGHPGEDVVCNLSGTVIIKRVDQAGHLYSVNPDYPLRYISGDDYVEIMGKVVGVVEQEDKPGKNDETLLNELFRDELKEFYAEYGISEWD